MAEFIVTDPTTGQKLRLTGDSPPTEAELEQVFAAQVPSREEREARIASLEVEQAALDQPGVLQGAAEIVGGTLSDIRGLPEAALQLATGGAATAAGGIAAIPVTAVEALRGGEDPAAAGRAVIERFQELGTFEPRTEVGQRASAAIAAPLESFEQFADRIGEITGESDDTLGATAVKTAILGAPALFGLRRGVVTTRPSPKPTPRQQVAATAAEEGYVTSPSIRGEAGTAGLAEGLGGPAQTTRIAIERNQVITDKLASRAVGLPEGTPISIDTLQGIRSQAGQAYEAVRGVGQVFTDTAFRRDLSAATARFRSAAKDFPELAKSEVIDIVDSLRIAEFDAGAGIDAISLLRNRGDVAFRGGDKALGNAYRAASDAIEGVMERHLGRGGDPILFDGFRQARQQIAKTYSVQEALQGRITGEVSAIQLASQIRRKDAKPLTGDLRTIADFANTFPTVSKLFVGTAQKLSAADFLLSGGISGVGLAGGLGPLAAIPIAISVSRPLLQRAALTDVARRSGLAGESVRPSAAVTTGGGLSAVAADQ